MLIKKLGRKFLNFYKQHLFGEECLMLSSIHRSTQEILWANVFRDSILSVEWVQNKSFSPSGAAANYSFLYILFRVLSECAPLSILEFGIGQTTKLTSQYVTYENKKSSLFLVEHDDVWINLFKKNIPENKNITICHFDIEQRKFEGFDVLAYKGLETKLKDIRFNVIISDGMSSKRYSRSYVVGLVEKNLQDSFVMIFDDCDRVGETETAQMVMNKLSFLGVDYGMTAYEGSKKQIVIYSKNFNFLKWL